MPTVNRATAVGASATVTSERIYPQPGHTQITVYVSAGAAAGLTFRTYAIDPGTGYAGDLDGADQSVSAGGSTPRSYQITAPCLEVRVTGLGVTATTATISYETGGVLC